MSAVKIRILPPGSYPTIEGLVRGLRIFILVVSLLAILFAATFPFDFTPSVRGRPFDWRWNPYDPGYTDRIENILLFVPFGFGLASVIRSRKFMRAIQLSAALTLGAILTTSVEIIQMYVSFRDPSLADLWCNTLGSVTGAILFMLSGEKALRMAARQLLRLKPLAEPSLLAGLLTAYSLLHLAAPLVIRNPADLSVWDTTMPLIVGNELSGDRGWHGAIRQIVLADRAASARQAYDLAHGADPASIFGSSLIGHYELKGQAPYSDLSGHLPPLQWADKPSEPTSDDLVMVSPTNWLRTAVAVAPATWRIRQSRQFTLACLVQTFNPDQHGPARILSISRKVGDHNLQIGQEYSSLSLRVRTAVRSMPDLDLAGAFADTHWHHIVVTHKDAQIVAYLDGYEHGRVQITPEAKVIWRLYPRGGVRLRMEKYGLGSYAAIYRLLVFIPFSALLGAMLRTGRWNAKMKRWIAVLAILAMTAPLETILALQTAAGFQLKNPLISLAIELVTLWAVTRKKAGTVSAV